MLVYLGEMDCPGDLIDRVGESTVYKAWCGKLNYFKNLSDESIFGVGDYEAEALFESGEVVN